MWWSYGGLLLNQSREPVTKLGHGLRGRTNPNPSPSYSWRLLGIRASDTTSQECGTSRNLCFLPLTSIRAFSSFSPSDSNAFKSNGAGDGNGNGGEEAISFAEAKRLMRLVNVEALKMKLGAEGKEAISYCELLEACESIGVARSQEEAAAFARILDEAGVVLLFRDKVYLHPDKVQSFFFMIIIIVNLINLIS